jgi:hypothetical protein
MLQTFRAVCTVVVFHILPVVARHGFLARVNVDCEPDCLGQVIRCTEARSGARQCPELLSQRGELCARFGLRYARRKRFDLPCDRD